MHKNTDFEYDVLPSGTEFKYFQKTWRDPGTIQRVPDVALCVPVRMVDPTSFRRFTGLEYSTVEGGRKRPLNGSQRFKESAAEEAKSDVGSAEHPTLKMLWPAETYLASSAPEPVIAKTPDHGVPGPKSTRLSIACREGNKERVMELVAVYPNDLDVRVARGRSPLHFWRWPGAIST